MYGWQGGHQISPILAGLQLLLWSLDQRSWISPSDVINIEAEISAIASNESGAASRQRTTTDLRRQQQLFFIVFLIFLAAAAGRRETVIRTEARAPQFLLAGYHRRRLSLLGRSKSKHVLLAAGDAHRRATTTTWLRCWL